MRIFDVYLYEGEKILFRAGLAILKIKEKELSNLNDFEEIMMNLKEIIQKNQEEEFIKIMTKDFTFSKKTLNVRFYMFYYCVGIIRDRILDNDIIIGVIMISF